MPDTGTDGRTGTTHIVCDDSGVGGGRREKKLSASCPEERSRPAVQCGSVVMGHSW